MIGLIKKDLLILKAQKIYIFLGVFLAISLTIGYELPIAGIFAGTMMASTLCLTTIAYDDFGNGTAFLLTLLITRKIYVAEKYFLSLLMSTAACLISSLLLLLIKFNVFSSGAFVKILQIACAIPISVCLPALLIPINLKFGSERGRMVMIILFIFLGILFSALSTFVQASTVVGLLAFVAGLNPLLLFALVVVACALIVLASAAISTQIMRKKEF